MYPWLRAPSDPPPTPQEVARSAAGAQAHWERFGFGLWLLRDRQTGEAVGRGGVRWAGLAGVPNVEVAWAIVSRRWGQGLATELARESVRIGFEELELDELIAYTLPHNTASRRVMEKAGLAYDRDIVVEQMPHVLYRLRR